MRELHELPSTVIVQSGTIRLASLSTDTTDAVKPQNHFTKQNCFLDFQVCSLLRNLFLQIGSVYGISSSSSLHNGT